MENPTDIVSAFFARDANDVPVGLPEAGHGINIGAAFFVI